MKEIIWTIAEVVAALVALLSGVESDAHDGCYLDVEEETFMDVGRSCADIPDDRCLLRFS